MALAIGSSEPFLRVLMVKNLGNSLHQRAGEGRAWLCCWLTLQGVGCKPAWLCSQLWEGAGGFSSASAPGCWGLLALPNRFRCQISFSLV